MNAALPPGWDVVPLESLLVTPQDLTYGVVQPGANELDGVPVARVGDIRDGRVNLSNPLRIAANVESRYARSRIEGGELLVTLVGTVGECAIAPSVMRGWNVARAVAVAKIRPDVGARWVARCLGDGDAVARILSRVNTTVQTTLNLADLRQIPVVLPPKADRVAIAAVADALDDQIGSNRRAIDLIQDLSRSTYFAWRVVHPDPRDHVRRIHGRVWRRYAQDYGTKVLGRRYCLGDTDGHHRPEGSVSIRNSPDDLLAALYADPDVTALLAQHRLPARPQPGTITDRFPTPLPVTEPLLRDVYLHVGLSARHLELLTGQPAEQILDALHAADIPVRERGLSPWVTRQRGN